MRIISQDGKADFPYENAVIYAIDQPPQVVITGNAWGKSTIGTYRSIERCRQIMEDMQLQYTLNQLHFYMPKE